MQTLNLQNEKEVTVLTKNREAWKASTTRSIAIET